jgi:transposase-like protein
METFPTNIFEFTQRFASEEACWQYLANIRWPKGFRCPIDGLPPRTFVKTRKLWTCPNGHQTSVTAGTTMHLTRTPLTKWFWAAYLMVANKPGISALQLQKHVGGRLETAFIILHKLRAAMVNPDRTKLSGYVEVDETIIGSSEAGKGHAGRAYVEGKSIVVGAVEVHGDYSGRIRMRKVDTFKEHDLVGFIRDHIEPGSTVATDGFLAYQNLRRYGYNHVVIEGATSKEVAQKMPKIHIAFGNLKTWLNGTHHGVSGKHMQGYLNEYVYRWNRRENPMQSFLTLLGIVVRVKAPEYYKLYHAGERGGWVHMNGIGVDD